MFNDKCECDNTHKAVNTVCKWCFELGRRKWDDPKIPNFDQRKCKYFCEFRQELAIWALRYEKMRRDKDIDFAHGVARGLLEAIQLINDAHDEVEVRVAKGLRAEGFSEKEIREALE